MTSAVISLVYKNKGHRHSEKAYRPLAVTDAVYRILARATAQQLAQAAAHILGDEQVGFVMLRRLEENTIKLFETMRYADEVNPAAGEGWYAS